MVKKELVGQVDEVSIGSSAVYRDTSDLMYLDLENGINRSATVEHRM